MSGQKRKFYSSYRRRFREKLRMLEWTRNFQVLCAYCPTRLSSSSATFDHYVPLSLGGSSRLENVVPCCERCNQEKADNVGWIIRNKTPGFGWLAQKISDKLLTNQPVLMQLFRVAEKGR